MEERPSPEKRRACADGHLDSCVELDRDCREHADKCSLLGKELPAYRWLRASSPISNDEVGLDATAHEGARVLAMSRAGNQVRVAALQFPIDHPGTLLLNGTVPDAVLQEQVRLPAPRGPSGGIPIENHAVVLVSRREGAHWTLELQCGPAEIVAQVRSAGEPGITWQQISQVKDAVEVRAWTNDPIDRSWGGHTCAERTVIMRPRLGEPFQHGFFSGQALMKTVQWSPPAEPGAEDDDEAAYRRLADAPVPDGFRRVDPEVIRAAMQGLERGARVYSIQPIDEGRCVERVVGRDLRYSYDESLGDSPSRVEVRFALGLFAGGEIELRGPSITRWERGRRRGVAFGCLTSLRVVGSDDEGLLLVSGRFPVLAYHPDDVARWYRTREACERALSEHPRVSIAELVRHGGAKATAQVGPRVTRGC